MLGPRQVGKTTLARQLIDSAQEGATVFDLEDDRDLAKLVELLTRRLRAESEECFFWATHAGAELNLLVISGDTRLGFEVKRTTSPKVTKSMRMARETLGLELVRVVHAGRDSYPFQEGFRAVSVYQLLDEVQPLPHR